VSDSDNFSPPDEGLTVLVQLLHFLGLSVDAAQVRHNVGAVPIGISDMLRYAKRTGLKAGCYSTTYQRLARTPLPGIAVLRDGGFLLLGKVGDGKVLVQSPRQARPQLMSQAELEGTSNNDDFVVRYPAAVA
jgi:ATP-binding cassette, subfamily B, bacterial HlyB/CyaB